MLREARKNCGMPIWKVAAAVPHHQGNIQRIERGTTEPRIVLAIRLLLAIGADVGVFMEELAIKSGWRQGSGEIHPKKEESEHTDTPAHHEKHFGHLLRETRLAYGKSQKSVAEEAAYTVRNLINVENGRQEPKVMTALKLVCATGCDVASFFNELAALYSREDSQK